MRWIALLLGLMLTASGCAMIGENASLRKENANLKKEATAAQMRADRLQRDLDYARKHPESLRAIPSSVLAKAAPQPGPDAAAARPAPRGVGKTRIVIGESEVAAEAKAAAQNEAGRLNTLIAGVKADFDLVGADSDKYATAYNGLHDAVDVSRNTVTLFDESVAPVLDPLPPPPSDAAQARYDAVRMEEIRRAEEARRAQEETAQKREAAKEVQASREATAKAATAAAVQAVEKNTPPPVMVVPGVIGTPAPTPVPNGGTLSGSKMQ